MTERGSLHEVQRPGRRVATVLRPATWDEAVDALGRHPDARPVAGGTDLVVELDHTEGPPLTLVDLTAIDGYRSIDETAEALVLAAGVTHNQIVADARFRQAALPLAQACLEVGSPQLRNRATIAGNLVTASPANDTISALMALGATLELVSVAGPRTVAVADFFTGFRSTVLAHGELVRRIRVPRLGPDERGVWVKLGNRRAQAISVVHAGLVVAFDPAGVVTDARLALGSVAPTVVMSEALAPMLVGRTLDDEAIREAAQAVAASVEPIDDVRATAAYRRAVTATLIERALGALADGDAAARWPTDPPSLAAASRSTASRSRRSGPAHATLDDATEITVTVNGAEVRADHAASTVLLDWLRDHAGPEGSAGPLSGVKEGCAEGECGACTVQLDGEAVMSCLVPAAQADGAEVVTVEGLGDADGLHPIQDAFLTEFAVQCGYCIPGFLVAGAALLDECPAPSAEQIRLGLAGNLCRCTGYYPITQAVEVAAARTREAT